MGRLLSSSWRSTRALPVSSSLIGSQLFAVPPPNRTCSSCVCCEHAPLPPLSLQHPSPRVPSAALAGGVGGGGVNVTTFREHGSG